MKLKSILAVALVASASSAMAGDFYVLGAAGQSKFDIDKGAMDGAVRSVAGVALTSSSTDDSDTAYKLQFGWQFHKNFALEGGYVDLGKAQYQANFTSGGTAYSLNSDAKVDGWNIGIVGTLPVADSLSVFGKLGTIYAKTDASASVGPVNVGGNERQWRGNWGLGATYDFTKTVSVRAEWEQFDLSNDIGTTDMWSVGLVFKF